MIPIKLTLTNYGPFYGEHVIELGPVIYSVVATDELDPERSNWIGKSWFLSAFVYALFGKHPGRLKDRMISDGESEGIIRLDLDTGLSIVRSKKRGVSEQLVVRRPDFEDAKQESAQEIIEETIGFSYGDFRASCWIRQKGANDIIVVDPAIRTNMVSSWMGLGLLQKACDVEASRLSAVLDEDSKLAVKEEQLRTLIGTVEDASTLTAKIAELEFEIANDEKQLSEVEIQFTVSGKIERLGLLNEQLQRIVNDGKELKSRIAEQNDDSDLEQKLNEGDGWLRQADLRLSKATAEVARLKTLVVGSGFDGICPVTKRSCPVSEDVHATASKMHSELETAKQEAIDATNNCAELKAELNDIRKQTAVRAENISRLNAMRDQAKRLIDDIKRLETDIGDVDIDPVRIRAEYATLQAQIGSRRGELATLAKYMSDAVRWQEELDSAGKRRAALVSRITTCREATVVLGRNGAQKNIAAGYLSEIEVGANECLGGAGIDLSVKASWGREGTGIASNCSACGNPFPRSAKVKTCEKCGATRGQNIIEKLELEVSNDSAGAAQDVAGLAMQLSAAAWLRARRQSPWSSALVDEPFAATDARIGQLLAARLVSMLGGRYSFRQAFVISHNAMLTEMMPGRIIITRLKRGGRRIEVL